MTNSIHTARHTVKALIAMLLMVQALSSSAQQQQSFSQYHLNDFAFNPAIAGTKSYSCVQTVYRRQWAGVEGAPETMMAYYQGSLPTTAGNSGIGLMLYSDKAAAIKRNGVSATYAQHFGSDDGLHFSLALTGTANQYSLDRSILSKYLDPSDPLLNSSTSGKFGIDAGFSAYVYGEKWSIGAFADNLIESKIDFYNGSQARQYRHYYMMAQYEYMPDEDGDFSILPALLLKASENGPLQADANVSFIHQQNKWIGLSYRTNQTHSLSANVGFLASQKLVAGYSYDMVAGKANRFNTGQNSSHEITLGFRFLKNADDYELRQTRCPLF